MDSKMPKSRNEVLVEPMACHTTDGVEDHFKRPVASQIGPFGDTSVMARSFALTSLTLREIGP